MARTASNRPPLRAALLSLGLFLMAGSARGQEPPRPEPPKVPQASEAPVVVAIRVAGQKRYTEQQLVDALGQKIGAKLDAEAVDRGVDALWKVFRVRADKVEYRSVEGGIELRLTVVEMAVDLEPRFVGNVEIDTETLRRWAMIGERSELYLYQAPRVRQRLLEGYRREGYFFAEVDAVARGGEGGAQEGAVPDVIFEIREGPQVHVKDVILEGNRSLPETGAWFWKGGLKKLARLELAGPWLFNWKGAKFIEDTLQADLLAMRDVYRDLGYLDAVVELADPEFTPDRSGVRIHVVIDEGEPYRVSKLSIRAVEMKIDPATGKAVEAPAALLFPEEELLALCVLKPGRTFKRALQKTDGLSLRNHYGERGYISHPSLGIDSWEFLDPPSMRFDPARREVEVTYRIVQGRKRVIREVLFQGGEQTRDRVLRREISVLPGETANIREITRSLSRLYSTNYFTDEFAPLEHKDPVFRFIPVNDPEHPEWVDLEYEVQEGRVVNFQIQGGVDSNTGLFGRVSLRMGNFDSSNLPSSPWKMFGEIYDKEAFHGAGQLLDISLSPGTQVDSYYIRFVEPDLLRRHFDPVSLDLTLSRRDQRFRFYSEDRLDRRIRVGRQFGRELAVFLGITDQALDIGNIDSPLTGINDPFDPPVPRSLLDEEGRSDLVGGLFDVQYRNVDTFLNPREGVQVIWKNGVYGGPFGGDWQFVRSDLDFDWFWLTGSSVEEVRPGFHLGAGLGVADAFGDTSEVPYSERFFLGGSSLLRGFAYRGVGPNLRSIALGGETSLDASLEYRIPLYSVVQPGTYKNVEVFRMTLFLDAGVLDPDPFRIDFGEVRASVGVGLGLTYPIPLILSFGFPIASGDGDRRQAFSYRLINLWF